MEEMGNNMKILAGKSKGKRPFGNIRIHERTVSVSVGLFFYFNFDKNYMLIPCPMYVSHLFETRYHYDYSKPSIIRSNWGERSSGLSDNPDY
jgi:hypothetical protein